MNAWPRILEKDLNQRGIPARVYNEAIGGTSSASLVHNLPDLVEMYHPQIVVSMMGINDTPRVQLEDTMASQAHLKLSDIRLLKLASWAMGAVQARLSCQVSEYPHDYVRVRKYVDQVMEMRKSKNLDQICQFLKEEVRDEKEIATILSNTSVLLRGDSSDSADLTVTYAYINLAFKISPYDSEIAFWKSVRATSEMCEEAIQTLLPCARTIPDRVLAPENANPLSRHYEMMIQLLKEKGIKIIAMQYPTLSVDSLEKTISANNTKKENLESVVLVSNEKNFAQALEKKPYEEIFTDRFRGSWGHTTQYGYQMISDQVLSSVQGLVAQGCCHN